MGAIDTSYFPTDRAYKPDAEESLWLKPIQSRSASHQWLDDSMTLIEQDAPVSALWIDEPAFSPPKPKQFFTKEVFADAVPLATWAGTVVDVNLELNEMSVNLSLISGIGERHSAVIGLEWVSSQDKNLVRPGAVFYLTLSKQVTRSGTIRSSEEISFRRLPSWSGKQILNVAKAVDEIFESFKSPKVAPEND